jgi:hypothetical protein
MPGDKPKPHDMDEPVKIDLDPELALRALLKVDPDAPGATEKDSEPPQGDPLRP